MIALMKNAPSESRNTFPARLKREITRLNVGILYDSISELRPDAIYTIINYAQGWREPPIGAFLANQPPEKYKGYFGDVQNTRFALVELIMQERGIIPIENEDIPLKKKHELLDFSLTQTYHSAGIEETQAREHLKEDTELVKTTLDALEKLFEDKGKGAQIEIG